MAYKPLYHTSLKMKELSPQQLKKLERLAKVLDNGDVELLKQIDELEDKVDTEIQAVQSAVTDALSIAEQTKKMQGEQGVQGERGERGEKGDKGENGKDGVDGTNGKDGENGKDGRDGVDGKDGIDGKDGADGFVDESVVAYLEDEIKRVEDKIPKAVNHRETNFGLVVRDVIAGAGVSIDKTDPNRPVITSTGGAAWGEITGTLSNQTDLVVELDEIREQSIAFAIAL